MRILIDGYNVMYAGGLLGGRRLGPDGLRTVRRRFLNDLAAALGPVDAPQTVVVFDASHPPDHVPSQTDHKGLTILFAVDDEDADTRIEHLIARHSTPKALTVVSSDHRLRQAAARRKAQVVTAEAFWVDLDARKQRRNARSRGPAPPHRSDRDTVGPDEAAFWHEQFAGLDQAPETREALNAEPPLLSDDEIAQIEREVAREFE